MSKLFKNLNLKTKLVSIVFAVAFAAILGVSSFSHFLYQDALLQDGVARMKVTSEKYADEVDKIFELSLGSVENLSMTLAQMIKSDVTDRQLAGNIVLNELENNPEFKCIWVYFEQNAFDGKDSEFIDDDDNFGNESGRFVPGFHRVDNSKTVYDPIFESDIEEDAATDRFYQLCNDGLGVTIFEPADYHYEGDEYPTKTFSIECPIKIDDQCIGIIGTDLTFAVFEKSLKRMELYPGSYAQLIGHTGKVVLHPDSALIDKQLSMSGNGMSANDIISKIKSGKQMFFKNNIDGRAYYHAFMPIILSNVDMPWSLCISVPEDSMLAEATHIIELTSLMFVLGILFLIVCVYITVNRIIKPITGAYNVLSCLSFGNISKAEELPVKNNDEIGKMSKALNALTVGLRNILNFAEKIGVGDYATEYHLLSEKDELGTKMIEMRNNLAESAEKEKIFKEEEERRSWVNQGIAEFSDILRNNSQDMEGLSYQIISSLVKYLDANQGGLFILNNDDETQPYLELAASYAYDRRKYLQKKVEPGEGLVGACYQEGETIYMNDIPDGYIHITSGIGEANPKVLVIVPLKMNDVIYGVFEIASFKDIEPYQVDFLEKIGVTTASTISSVKINLHTSKLLEQSQLQAQQLGEQEEEMRQNMEEMQATQEEMARRNREAEFTEKQLNETLKEMQEVQNALMDEKIEIQSIMDAVDKIFIRTTYSPEMILLDLNERCLDFYDSTREELIGMRLTDKMNPSDIPDFEKSWKKILAGETYQSDGVRKTSKGDKHIWYMYTPIKNTSGQVDKVLMLGRILEDI